jgi:hypothetical protein
MTMTFKGAASPRDLAPALFVEAAARLGCDLAAIKAIWDVEAGGDHFLPDGSVIRRFEPHHFPRQHWDRIGFSVRKGERPWRASLRLSNEAMFLRAWAVAPDATAEASSWGAPQIMGFNARDAGFRNARSMVEAMATGAPQQLTAFVQLVESWGIATALRAHDWRAFARRYNGSGQVEHYARLMEEAYRRHSGQRSREVLRAGSRGAGVRALQAALAIDVDGVFGPGTHKAVVRKQERLGLVADGIVGHKTWQALVGEVAPFRIAAPVQETPADARTTQAQGLAGALAVVSAVAAAAGQLRDVLPEGAYTWAAGAAIVAALAFGLAAAVRWVRA